jgi:hypothetical protein
MSRISLVMKGEELKETEINTEDIEVICDYLKRLDDSVDDMNINISVEVNG